MKKIIILALTISALATIFGTRAFAQQASISKDSQPGSEIYGRVEDNKAPTASTDVDKRVLKAFTKSNGNVENANWYKVEKGYAVMFKGNGMRTTIFYANNGVMDAKLNFYGEEKMPAAVYSLIKSSFPEFAINSVVEIHKNSIISHHVKLEGKKTIQTVKVIGDEWEVTEVFNKI